MLSPPHTRFGVMSIDIDEATFDVMFCTLFPDVVFHSIDELPICESTSIGVIEAATGGAGSPANPEAVETPDCDGDGELDGVALLNLASRLRLI